MSKNSETRRVAMSVEHIALMVNFINKILNGLEIFAARVFFVIYLYRSLHMHLSFAVCERESNNDHCEHRIRCKLYITSWRQMVTNARAAS